MIGKEGSDVWGLVDVGSRKNMFTEISISSHEDASRVLVPQSPGTSIFLNANKNVSLGNWVHLGAPLTVKTKG